MMKHLKPWIVILVICVHWGVANGQSIPVNRAGGVPKAEEVGAGKLPAELHFSAEIGITFRLFSQGTKA
ncbi:hypothetical protein [Dyadobacter sp. OTU695]|uniref:hypothetical protein n=1 Tax=Dyadobacter sp. OTU695 TaxID=3043860 RepID=UPI00313D9875